MGNHRADRRGPIRRPSKASKDSQVRRPQASPGGDSRAGRRVESPRWRDLRAACDPHSTPTSRDHRAPIPTVRPLPASARRSSTPASRGPLFQGLPSPAGPARRGRARRGRRRRGHRRRRRPGRQHEPRYNAASAVSGASGVGSVNLTDRDPPGQPRLEPRRPRGRLRHRARRGGRGGGGAAQRRARPAGQARREAGRQDRARTAGCCRSRPPSSPPRFGEYGLWSSYHTGLDFNGDDGDPIKSIANGVVTSVGYDGAYGNKTVVTLEDGTEIWYCHQTRSTSRGRDRPRRRGHRLRRLHRQRDRLPPAPRGPPRRRRPGRPLRGVRRARRHAVA